MIAILRKAGLVFHTIYEVYPGTAHESVLDPEWLRKCGENNWIVVTGDKRIETVPENRQAVIDSKVKVFLLNDSNSKPEVWAAAILLGQYKMQDLIDATSGPFFATIGKRCDTHVQRARRPADYSETPESEFVAREEDRESVQRVEPDAASVPSNADQPSQVTDAPTSQRLPF